MTREERMNWERCKNDTQRNHIRNIQEHGVSIISVFGKDGDDTPPWTYSIGFWQEYAHPEVLIMGLDGSLSGSVINGINRRIKDKGERFGAGVAINDLLSGEYTCYFETVQPTAYGDWLAGDDWFYGDHSFPVVQMLWPDLQGVYPWQQDAKQSLRNLQPVLSSLPRRGMQ